MLIFSHSVEITLLLYDLDVLFHIENFCVVGSNMFKVLQKLLLIGVSFVNFSCDSVEKLKSKCPMLEQEIRDSSRFKDFYQFTFNYAKNPGQKGLGECTVWHVQIFLTEILNGEV